MNFICQIHGPISDVQICPYCVESCATKATVKAADLYNSLYVEYAVKMVDCLKYYAQKHGNNSKAAVLLKELEIE